MNHSNNLISLKFNFLFAVILMAFLSSCSETQQIIPEEIVSNKVYIDTKGIDSTINPGDNFYQYANGNWEKNTEIPPGHASWGPWESLDSDIYKQVREILEAAAKSNAKKGSAEQKIGDFYTSGMDTITLEKLGVDPIRSTLSKIDAIKTTDDIIAFAADAYIVGESKLIKLNVEPDDKASHKQMLTLYQGGIMFPSNYYTGLDDHSKSALGYYHTFISRLFSLSGDSLNAAAYADNIIKLEKLLAASHFSLVDSDSPQKIYNKYALSDFQKKTPNINWTTILNHFGAKADTIIVREPSYYEALSALLKSQPLSVWKQKLKYDVLMNSSTFLNKDFYDAMRDLYGNMFGVNTPYDRSEDIVGYVDRGLGDLTGQLYVEKYFTADAKKRMLEMVNNLQAVFAEMIAAADWMEPATKQTAIAKLEAMTNKIGYTDKWKSYDGVEIDSKTYYANLQSIKKNAFKRMMEKMGKPVDRTQWNVAAQSLGGYNSSTFNAIVFPAGSLQYPFFDPQADDAVNYGAIGMIIGHEITHGFDDYGRQYDGAGNLMDWWSEADAQKFNDKAAKVTDFYNKISVLNDHHVDGVTTLTENIADLGGVNIAYQAFKKTDQGKGNELIDGFTPDQRFFLSFAQVWRSKATDELIINYLKMDTHSPPIARVNGCVYNMDSFYTAFDIPVTAKRYVAPEDRIGIW